MPLAQYSQVSKHLLGIRGLSGFLMKICQTDPKKNNPATPVTLVSDSDIAHPRHQLHHDFLNLIPFRE